ncbi:MAG: aldo/keto reductase [Deltaproteobacteria bacterium]|nr:aldo/keto reductase [Deltaproteobacteria bacterium]
MRFIGKTGVKVSRIGLGTMTFGGDADEATSRAIFERAREAGVNHFDTADVYNRGRSEELLGSFVAGCRDEVVIATKAYFATGNDPNARGGSRYHLVRAVESSLRRLRTDRIDLFYLHRWDDATHLEETLRAVEHLVSRGMILYPAVSNFSAWQTAKALGVQSRLGFSPLVAIQPMYNLVKRQAEVEIFPMTVSEGLAAFPYSPLGGGLLSGKYGVGNRPESGRLSAWEIYRVRYGESFNYEVADRFRQLAAEAGLAPATLALAWVMSSPAVTAPLVGVRNVQQLEPLLAAMELHLDPALRARVSALVPDPPPATDRNEEGRVHTLGQR